MANLIDEIASEMFGDVKTLIKVEQAREAMRELAERLAQQFESHFKGLDGGYAVSKIREWCGLEGSDHGK